MIILTEAQVKELGIIDDKGLINTSPGHAIAPVPLKDGTYALPERVLQDNAHKLKHDFLKTKPKRTVEKQNFDYTKDIKTLQEPKKGAKLTSIRP